LLPVARGQSVMVSVTAGTAINITCRFIPPVVDTTPNPTAPHTWRNDGVEIDFKDGSFGRKYTGHITQVGGVPSTTIFLQGNYNIIDAGGWWNPGTTVQAQINGTLRNTTAGSGHDINWTSLLYKGITPGNNIVLQTCTVTDRTGTSDMNSYSVWIRYTK